MDPMERAEASRHIKSVRRRQVFLVGAGVAGALVWPLSAVVETFVITMTLSILMMVAVPIAWVLFALAVDRSVTALAGPGGARGAPAWALGLATAVPLIGTILEIVLIHRLARMTHRLETSGDRTSLVIVLALLRLGAMWMVPVFAGALIGVGDLPVIALVYSIGPLVSFAMLSVITQLIITPLLDHLVPERAAVRLGGAGATSSMAVSSTTTTD